MDKDRPAPGETMVWPPSVTPEIEAKFRALAAEKRQAPQLIWNHRSQEWEEYGGPELEVQPVGWDKVRPEPVKWYRTPSEAAAARGNRICKHCWNEHQRGTDCSRCQQ